MLGPAGQVGAHAFPDHAPGDADLRDQVDLPPPAVVTERLRPDGQVQRLVQADRPRDGDPVLDVDGAKEREREPVAAHHDHLEREGEQVGVRDRQCVAHAEPAHPVVCRQVGQLDPHTGA
jgi:hypothetical protein